MLKNIIKSLKRLPIKGKAEYVKKLLASNAAFMAIMLPTSNSSVEVSSTSLMIPQEQLNNSFKVEINQTEDPAIQVPMSYIYMSQGFTSYHPAIDLAADPKTPIKPILPGTVIEAGYSTYGYGNSVVIQHKNGLESRYAHLSKISVKFGQKVSENTVIGNVGSTGHSTGIHLHLEIHQNGKTLNPLSVLPAIYKNGLITSK